MAQVSALIDALKLSLKAHGKTYRDVGKVLNLSEASVKRLFAKRDFDLNRLEMVCGYMGMEISDLVQVMHEQRGQLQQLTAEAEEEIASNLTLAMVAVCVLNRWTLADILDVYTLTEPQAIQCLATLDKLRLIELLPKNRIKLLVAPNFRWRTGGPIEQFFMQAIEREFFASRFEKKDHKLVVLNGMLSGNSNAEFQRKIERLARDFNELNDEDAALPLPERKGATVVLAMRDWRYGIFSQLRKQG